MIKATDFRPGNLVLRVDNYTARVTALDLEADTIMIESPYNWVKDGTTGDTFLISSGKVAGIRLTPRWLMKCGFIDPAGNGMAYRINVNSADELCWYAIEKHINYQTQGSGFTRCLPHIKFVHQLQNWWFSFTGLELLINENA